MKIITKNCYGAFLYHSKKRLKIILQKIIKLKPDFIFLQEIYNPLYLKEIAATGYIPIFQKKGFIIKGGLIILIKNRECILSYKFIKFKSQGKILNMQIFDRFVEKGFLHLKVKSGFNLINTHLLATYPTTHFVLDKNQENQLKQLKHYLKQFKDIFIVGDFNFDQDSPYYKIMSKGYYDLTYNMGYTDLKNKRKLDFIFSDKKYQVKEHSLLEFNSSFLVSDHRGIFINI